MWLELAKQLFQASTEDVGNIQPHLSRILGSGSVFALDGTDHRRRRKLLDASVRRRHPAVRVGAAFANVEMAVVLRTVLRHFAIEPTPAPGEKVHSRGVAYTRSPATGSSCAAAPRRWGSSGYRLAVCRLGSFQPGRGKWQV